MLKPQDHLIITVPETESGENIIRTKMDLNIIYEDEDILVINKPADMPVHPSAGNYENTLANGIAWYFCRKRRRFLFYRCINRLDRDTTGALILAKKSPQRSDSVSSDEKTSDSQDLSRTCRRASS